MDAILQVLIDEFASNHFANKALNGSILFEHFVNYTCLHGYTAYSPKPETLHCGGSQDCHCDGLAIIINDQIAESLNEAESILSGAALIEVTFCFVQAKSGPGFKASDIGLFLGGAHEFLGGKPQFQVNERIAELLKVRELIFENIAKLKKGRPRCHLFFATSGKWLEDPVLKAAIDRGINQINNSRFVDKPSFYPFDADALLERYQKIKLDNEVTIRFPKHVSIGPLQDVSQSYVGVISARQYLKLLMDEERDVLLKSVFQDNVRDWSGHNDVNCEILSSLSSEIKRSHFALLNNGVTVVAKQVTVVGDDFVLKGYSIVNGCQTSHAIFESRSEIGEEVYLPIKIIASQNSELVSDVIRATNRQTEIKEEQFLASSKFHQRLEIFFTSQSITEGRLYYERKQNQYDGQRIDRALVISMPEVLKSYVSMFLFLPHIANKNYRSILSSEENPDVFKDVNRVEYYFISSLALFRIDQALNNQIIDRKYIPARFHMLTAIGVLFFGNRNPAAKKLSQIREILGCPSKSRSLIKVIASEIWELANQDLDRDIIRKKPFTDEVIRQLKLQSSENVAKGLDIQDEWIGTLFEASNRDK